MLRAKGCQMSARLEAALLLVPRDLFVPRDRHREAFRSARIYGAGVRSSSSSVHEWGSSSRGEK